MCFFSAERRVSVIPRPSVYLIAISLRHQLHPFTVLTRDSLSVSCQGINRQGEGVVIVSEGREHLCMRVLCVSCVLRGRGTCTLCIHICRCSNCETRGVHSLPTHCQQQPFPFHSFLPMSFRVGNLLTHNLFFDFSDMNDIKLDSSFKNRQLGSETDQQETKGPQKRLTFRSRRPQHQVTESSPRVATS